MLMSPEIMRRIDAGRKIVSMLLWRLYSEGHAETDNSS
jgi:hypothetical protein